MLKNTTKIIAVLAILCICLSSVALAGGEQIVNDNFNGITEGIDVKTLSGWRAVSDYDLTTLFKATAKDDAMQITYGTRTGTWETLATKFYRDLPDYGEGLYEISYRFKAENFTNSVPRLFIPMGYTDNNGTKTEKCLIFHSFGSLKFTDGESNTLDDASSSACPRTVGKWIEFKYTIDTIANTATASYKIDGEEDWTSASGNIGAADGISCLRLDMHFGTGATSGTAEHTAAMKGEYYFDDVVVVYHDSPKVASTLPLEGSEDVDNVGTSVQLNFDTAMDESTITEDSILVYEGESTEPLSKDAYEVSCTSDSFGNTIATVEFVNTLPFATDYTVKVLGGSVASQEYGMNLKEDFTLKFKTKPEAYITTISVIDGDLAPVDDLTSMVGETITVDMSIKANYEASPYIAVVTIEDADGTMLMMANAQGTVDTVNASSFKPTFTVPENAKTIRAFLWKDYTSALPLAAEAVFVSE